MDNVNPTSKARRDSRGLAHPISISIIYEDAMSRADAARLCGRLADNLRPEFQFRLKWWPFELFKDTKASKAATALTAQADLVIVSARAGRDLPSKVKNWMEACLTKRTIPDGALVALLRMAKDLKKGAAPVHGFLCSIARRAKMDYMPEIIYPAPARR